jgi:hypothetical protein
MVCPIYESGARCVQGFPFRWAGAKSPGYAEFKLGPSTMGALPLRFGGKSI